MNRYLDQLKRKPPSVSSVSAPDDHIGKAKQAFGSFVSAPSGHSEIREIPVVWAECAGALRAPDGGWYLPWGPYMNADLLKQWHRELFEAVDELSRLEGWPDDHFDLVVGAIERQPVSTLRPDLAHFRMRLDKARAAAATGRQHEPR